MEILMAIIYSKKKQIFLHRLMDSNIKENHLLFKEYKEDKLEYNSKMLLQICILDNCLKGTISSPKWSNSHRVIWCKWIIPVEAKFDKHHLETLPSIKDLNNFMEKIVVIHFQLAAIKLIHLGKRYLSFIKLNNNNNNKHNLHSLFLLKFLIHRIQANILLQLTLRLKIKKVSHHLLGMRLCHLLDHWIYLRNWQYPQLILIKWEFNNNNSLLMEIIITSSREDLQANLLATFFLLLWKQTKILINTVVWSLKNKKLIICRKNCKIFLLLLLLKRRVLHNKDRKIQNKVHNLQLFPSFRRFRIKKREMHLFLKKLREIQAILSSKRNWKILRFRIRWMSIR